MINKAPGGNGKPYNPDNIKLGMIRKPNSERIREALGIAVSPMNKPLVSGEEMGTRIHPDKRQERYQQKIELVPTIYGKTYFQYQKAADAARENLNAEDTPSRKIIETRLEIERQKTTYKEQTIAGKTYAQRIREPLWQPKPDTPNNGDVSPLAGSVGLAMLIVIAYFLHNGSTEGAILSVLGFISIGNLIAIISPDGDTGIHLVLMLLCGLPPLAVLAALAGAPKLAGFFLLAWMVWIIFIVWVFATGAMRDLAKSIGGKN